MIVKVYRNLHKNCFSIQDAKTRKVIAYSNEIKLKNVKFLVSQTGRNRVLKENRKNVHAYVVGEITNYVQITNQEVKYNPYLYASFTIDNNPIYESKYVLLVNGKVYI